MPKPRKKFATRLAQEAQFVFRGTVQQRGAATLDQVPLTRGTLVVTVDEILKGPELLRGFQGADVTVQLEAGQSADAGKTYAFYTNGWLYGAGLAVRAVAVAPDSETGRLEARVSAEERPGRAIQQRAQSAELVVSGQVTAVRAARRVTRRPITEHEPDWREAVVTVESREGGRTSTSARGPAQVVVRFAASRDVRWAQAPKFSVGQAGLWMLGHKDKKEAAALRAAAGAQKSEYVVVDPEDFYPAESAERVRSLLKK